MRSHSVNKAIVTGSILFGLLASTEIYMRYMGEKQYQQQVECSRYLQMKTIMPTGIIDTSRFEMVDWTNPKTLKKGEYVSRKGVFSVLYHLVSSLASEQPDPEKFDYDNCKWLENPQLKL